MKKNIFLKSLGVMPQKSPLNAEILETIDCGTYDQQKVRYSSEKNEFITAYLLIPKNIQAPLPVVFCYHQHAGNFALGKSEIVGLAGDPDQAYAKELAERGYIAFAPDAIGFEERNWSEDKSAKASYFELTTRLVKGETLLGKVLHDLSTGIDYLETRPEIDKTKIGFIGHSYGGRMALWGPAFDKRIKASVSHCGCVNYKNSLTRDAGIQMEFCVPDIMNLYDIEDVVHLIEPASLYISATDDDKWSRGAKELYESAKPTFKKGELEFKLWSGKHVFTKEMREKAYTFLDKHLKITP